MNKTILKTRQILVEGFQLTSSPQVKARMLNATQINQGSFSGVCCDFFSQLMSSADSFLSSDVTKQGYIVMHS
jgi:hypothetical protein